jgi:tight adherence protein C
MAGYIALSWGICLFAAMTFLLSPFGAQHDIVRRRVSDIVNKSRKISVLDEELSKPLSERFFRPAIRALSSKFQKYAGKNSSPGHETDKQRSSKLKKMLRQAGMSMSVSEYSLIRFIVITGTAALFGIISVFLGLGIRALLGVLLGLYAGYAWMRFQLSAKISKRRRSMERQLPDVLDLLSVNVEAGLGFEQALLQVIAPRR